MKTLILLRHAKSDHTDGNASDHERHLASRGRLDAPLVGRWIERAGLVPDRVLCSDAVRTRQTWTLVAEEWEESRGARFSQVSYRPGLYLASAARILRIVGADAEDADSLMVIGHNPGMHDLAQALVAPGATAAHRRLARKFPTGAVAVVTFDIARWNTLDPGRGELAAFTRPKDLRGEDPLGR